MYYYLGLALGQAQDPMALCVLRRDTQGGKATYAGQHLERIPLGTAYPAIVERVRTLMQTPELRGRTRLVVDATGVGRAVIDMLRAARLDLVAITITGGDTVHQEGTSWRVPKRDLVSTLQVLLQTRRITFAERLPEVATLVQELLNFHVKLADSAHDTYGAWREGSHDDLVLAVAVAAWYAEHGPRPLPGLGLFQAKVKGWGYGNDAAVPSWAPIIEGVLGREVKEYWREEQ